jgi:hypothetical protein
LSVAAVSMSATAISEPWPWSADDDACDGNVSERRLSIALGIRQSSHPTHHSASRPRAPPSEYPGPSTIVPVSVPRPSVWSGSSASNGGCRRPSAS